jgi:hypothetical protein
LSVADRLPYRRAVATGGRHWGDERSLVGYDNNRASEADVVFAYDLALAAARDLWVLADQVRSHMAGWSGPIQTAQAEWTGPKRDQFDGHVTVLRTDTASVAAGLEETARALARNWAAARGEQDRINKARYVDAELDDDNILEDMWEWFAGENDFGPPPENPPVPGPPAFAVTRAPLYPDYERR